MQDILIFGGIAINIIGALLIAIFASRYYMKYRQVKNMPTRVSELKADWIRKRAIGWGVLLGGSLMAIIGCMI